MLREEERKKPKPNRDYSLLFHRPGTFFLVLLCKEVGVLLGFQFPQSHHQGWAFLGLGLSPGKAGGQAPRPPQVGRAPFLVLLPENCVSLSLSLPVLTVPFSSAAHLGVKAEVQKVKGKKT